MRFACLALMLLSVVGRPVLVQAQPSAIASSPVDFSNPALVQLDPLHIEALWSHLRASAAWRVTTEDGVLVATRRGLTGTPSEGADGPPEGSWRVESYELFPDFTESLMSVTLRQGSRPEIELARQAHRVKAGQGPVSLRIISESPGLPRSEVVVEGTGLQLEISEQSEDLSRAATQRAYNQVSQEIAGVLKGTSMPPSESTSTLPSEATLELESGSDSGLYEAVGYAATKQPGDVYIKAFRVADETPLSEETLRERTMEQVGWSDKTGLGFFYNSPVQIYEGGRHDPYPARFELWFVPADGGPERKLCQTSLTISGWER